MRKLIFTVLMFLPVVLMSDQVALLRVKVTGFNNDKGVSRVVLFNSKAGFPGEAGQAFGISDTKIVNGESVSEFKNVPYGFYAATVMHDVHGDRMLRRNFLGIPNEGVGASNNPRPFLRSPSFDDCKFEVKNSTVSIVVHLIYLP